MRTLHSTRLVRLATAYDADTTEPEPITVTIPEDLTVLDDAALASLREEAVNAFNGLYQSEEELGADDVAAMEALADGVEAIRAEEARRSEERAANRARADELAAQVVGSDDDEEDGEEDDGEPSGETDDDDGEPEGEATVEPVADEPVVEETAEVVDEPSGDVEAEPIAASGRRGPQAITVRGVHGLRRRQPASEQAAQRLVLTAAAELPGFANGQEITLEEASQAIVRRTAGINPKAFARAKQTGNRMVQSFGIATVSKEFPEELTVRDENADEVLAYAANESRLPGGSLVASAGWCSPSETLYDLFELESADGLYSLPEVNVTRGGIRFTTGPDFSDIWTGASGFHYTEAEVEEGDFDGYGAGTKPCVFVPCPEFTDVRLDVDGICINAGILQNRAYPETIARYLRGALIAHQHRLAGRIIDDVAALSTAVAMPADQVGAFAPILTAVELQVEHYRYVHRMSRNATLEAVFPYWVRGAIRSDLSRRLGVPIENVTNAVIGQHFAERGVAAQFVYNYQDIDGAASAFTSWASEVKFLLYAAGTFVRGSSDLITIENQFDSALYRENIFGALFTEEGSLVAMRGHDSREVTVPICPDGATHGGVDIDCDGSIVADGGDL